MSRVKAGCPIRQLAKENNLHENKILDWVRLYDRYGVDILRKRPKIKPTSDFKEQVVREILEKGLPLSHALIKYRISRTALEGWVRTVRKHGYPELHIFRRKGRPSQTMARPKKIAVQKSIELKKSYPEIDAFFCVSDSIAIGAIEGMGQLGVRVPDDVAIAGFDDYTVSQYIHGGITSIKQYPYKMGVACANTVISMIEGNRVPDWIPMEYKLMKRASTKK